MEPYIALFKNFLDESLTKEVFDSLVNDITWYDKLTSQVTGELVPIKRKMAYVSDIDKYEYKYATLSFPGQTWIKSLSDIRDSLNEKTGRSFNSVLLNWYKDGKDIIGWHADKEDALGDINTSVIACVNLGATRNFMFRKIGTKDDIAYPVSNGDLLMMNSGCQSEYLHAILKENVDEPRISLTFREVI